MAEGIGNALARRRGSVASVQRAYVLVVVEILRIYETAETLDDSRVRIRGVFTYRANETQDVRSQVPFGTFERMLE